MALCPTHQIPVNDLRRCFLSWLASPRDLVFVESTHINTAHTAQYSLFTSAFGSRIAQHLCALEKNLSSGPHMYHLLLLSHLPFATSTSSSSFAVPSTTTQAHAAQSGQHDLLQEHPVHHQLLQALPFEKQRHQEPLWRENLQSGGNPRKTFFTGYEPKELATVSRIARIIDPYQLHDAQKEFGEQGHQALITEEVEEFGEIGTAGLPDSKNIRDVQHPIADTLRRFRRKHCRF